MQLEQFHNIIIYLNVYKLPFLMNEKLTTSLVAQQYLW